MKTFASVLMLALAAATTPAAAQSFEATDWSAVIADYTRKGYTQYETERYVIWQSHVSRNALFYDKELNIGFNCQPPNRDRDLICKQYGANGRYRTTMAVPANDPHGLPW